MESWPPAGIEWYYHDESTAIAHADCRDILPTMPIAVELIVADPPYHRVVDEAWDKQWKNDSLYLEWLEEISAILESCLADNGSLYLFCTPRLSGRVEHVLMSRFRMLGHYIWDKSARRQGASGSGIDVSSLRTYWSAGTERILFAEKYGVAYAEADAHAREQSGYWQACQQVKHNIFGAYLAAEFARAKVARKEITALFPSHTGRTTGCVSNWLLGYNLPTREQYEAMRVYLNHKDSRQDYEYLRQDYEDLRRPVFLSPADQWGDIWKFHPPQDRQHPTQKPLGLLHQIVRVSSRPESILLDPFMGSGTALRASKDLGRKAIGIDIAEPNCEIAANRLRQEAFAFPSSHPISNGIPKQIALFSQD